jgi:hypothetical protein
VWVAARLLHRIPSVLTKGCSFPAFCRYFQSGAEGDRTPDLRAASAALSQLSYGPLKSRQSICSVPEGVNMSYSCQCCWGALRQRDSRR